MTAPHTPVLLVTALGPNPAPLAELLWALARKRRWLVVEALVVVTARGEAYLRSELLSRGGPLEELSALLGPGLAQGEHLRVRLARLPDGAPLEDDDEPAHAAAYSDAVWSAAREATQRAGPRPVVFALAAGRRRTMTAMVTTAYQMLARPGDVCVDVRVGDRRVEGGSGFFFPEQTRRHLETERGPVDAAGVEVHLVELALPRLRGLLREDELGSYPAALRASQQAVDVVSPPTLRVDLLAGEAFFGDRRLPLRASQLLWLAALASERKTTAEGWLGGNATALARQVRASAERPWFSQVKVQALLDLIAPGPLPEKSWEDDSLRKLRADVKRRLARFCEQHARPHLAELTPRRAQKRIDGTLVHLQRLPLPAARIEVLGGG